MARDIVLRANALCITLSKAVYGLTKLNEKVTAKIEIYRNNKWEYSQQLQFNPKLQYDGSINFPIYDQEYLNEKILYFFDAQIQSYGEVLIDHRLYEHLVLIPRKMEVVNIHSHGWYDPPQRFCSVTFD